MDTMTLYQPVGSAELELIRASGWRKFPPRLPEQPIFYPILNVEPATRIAREQSTRDGGAAYVVRFDVELEYLKQFLIQTAAPRIHYEYWIPWDRMDEFNRHILGLIEIVSEFRAPTKLPVQ